MERGARIEHYNTIEDTELAVVKLIRAGWQLHKVRKEDDGSFVAEFAQPDLSPYLEFPSHTAWAEDYIAYV